MSSTYAFALGFSRIVCGRCSAKRIRGVICPDCGEIPLAWEIDNSRTKRNAPTLEALNFLRSDLNDDDRYSVSFEPPLYLDQAGFFSEMLIWVPKFLNGLGEIVQEFNAQSVMVAIAGIRQLQVRLDRTPRVRPFITFLDGARDVLIEATSLMDDFLLALTATTPLKAQRLATTAQNHLDKCTKLAGIIGDAAEVLVICSSTDDPLRMFQDVLRLVGARRGATGVVETANSYMSEVSKCLGVEVDDVEVALLYALSVAIADVSLDRTRFDHCLAVAFDVFSSNEAVLRDLSVDQAFLGDARKAQLSIVDSWSTASDVIENARVERLIQKSFMELVRQLVERPGQLIAAALLICSGHKSSPYSKLRNKDATELLKNGQLVPHFCDLTGGLDGAIRTASAHLEFDCLDGRVKLTTRSADARVIENDQLVDLAYLGLESVFACLLALKCAMSHHGILCSIGPDSSDFGVDMVDWIRLGLATSTGSNAEVVSESPDLIKFRLDVATKEQTWNALGLISDHVVGQSLELEIVAGPEGEHLLRGPVDALANWNTSTDGVEKDMAFLILANRWTWDGEPVATREATRRAIAIHAGGQASTPFVDALREVRELRKAARAMGDAELDGVLRGFVTVRRLNETGVPRMPRDLECLDQLNRWLTAWVTSPLVV